MTFLTPLLIAGVYALIGYFTYKGISGSHDKVAVVSTHPHLDKLSRDKNITYEYVDQPVEEMKKSLQKSDYDYLLYIPDFPLSAPAGIQLYGTKQPGMSLSGRISRDIEELIRNRKLIESGISQHDLNALNTSVEVSTIKIEETGNEQSSSAGISTAIAFVAGILMFMFIMLYGIQVMRGVIEEKTSRIIEVIVSSVKPFQLMMGKIVGIALVGLTQFVLWIVLTFSISSVVMSLWADKTTIEQTVSTQNQLSEKSDPGANEQLPKEVKNNPLLSIQKNLENLPVAKIVSLFIFFFIGGYLFYSALYAAIGSAVDNETETQQFMMPVMLPLLMGYALSLSVVTNDPYGNVAFWLSMIPFTSPIAMVVRLPYGVPGWELALSMFILVTGFILTVWIAGRIYRVGILMYGKKTTFREMFKWFTYKP